MNDSPLGQLTLAYPRPAERQLLADLLEIDPDLAGFTTLHAEGHGHGFARASVEEQVSGRAERAVSVAPRGGGAGVPGIGGGVARRRSPLGDRSRTGRGSSSQGKNPYVAVAHRALPLQGAGIRVRRLSRNRAT